MDQTTTSSLVADDLRTSRHRQPHEAILQPLSSYAAQLQLPLMAVDRDTGVLLGTSTEGMLPILPVPVLRTLPALKDVQVLTLNSGLVFFAFPLPITRQIDALAVGYVLSAPDRHPQEAALTAAELNWTPRRFHSWQARQTYAHPRMVKNLVIQTVGHLRQSRTISKLETEVKQLAVQLQQNYEELALLHVLSRNLKLSHSPELLAELCLTRLHALTAAEGTLIWMSDAAGEKQVFRQGEIPLSEFELARFLASFDDHDWSQPLIKNNLQRTFPGTNFPGVKNCVIVPISHHEHRSGWIAGFNRTQGEGFSVVQGSVMSTVATILGTHLHNMQMYEDRDELLLSFVRSLVSTLDAKDPYTRGHSERVALIARRLGEELSLSEQELDDIYLCGLLHDIGKIGVNDEVLQKPGQLTKEEFEEIKLHPLIGYEILKGIRSLQDIIPGVRSHHESWNGRGYPDQLKGEAIPLLARILAVADSYDAMRSDRPYRKGMPLEKVEAIFERGADSQWDAEIIRAYFKCRTSIIHLCENYSLEEGTGIVLA